MIKKFLTIREVAKTGLLSENALRIMQKQGKLPCIKVGVKCLVNYNLLLEQLDQECKKAILL